MQYSGAHLQFVQQVASLTCKLAQPHLHPDEPPEFTLSISDIFFAEVGENGSIETIGGMRYAGEVTINPIVVPTKKTVPLPVLPTDPPSEAVEQAWTEALKNVPEKPKGFAQQVLDLVAVRGSDYGTPDRNHQLTAELWSAWLTRRADGRIISITAEDVCMLNVLQKASRLAFKTKDDSWVDILGYGENVALLRPEQRNT